MEGKTIPFYLLDREGNRTLLSTEICKANFLVLSDSPLLQASISEKFVKDTEQFYKKIRQTIPDENIDDIIELIEESVLDTDSKKELFNSTIATERASFLAFIFLFYNNRLEEIEEILSPNMTFESRSGKILRALYTDPDSEPPLYKLLFPQLETLLDNVITDFGEASGKVHYKYGFNSPHGTAILPFQRATFRGSTNSVIGNNCLLYPYYSSNQLCSTVDWRFKIDFKWWEFLIPLYANAVVLGAKIQAGIIESAKYLQKTFFSHKTPSWYSRNLTFNSGLDKVPFSYHKILGGVMSYSFFRDIIRKTFPKRNDMINNTDYSNDLKEMEDAVLNGFKRSSNSYFDERLTTYFTVGGKIFLPRGRHFKSNYNKNFYPSFLEQLREFIELDVLKSTELGKKLDDEFAFQDSYENDSDLVFQHNENNQRVGVLPDETGNISIYDDGIVEAEKELTINGYLNTILNCSEILNRVGTDFRESERFFLLDNLFKPENDFSNNGPKAILDAGVMYGEDDSSTFITSFSSNKFKDAYLAAREHLDDMIKNISEYEGNDNIDLQDLKDLQTISSFTNSGISDEETLNSFLVAYNSMLVKALNKVKPTDIHLGTGPMGGYNMVIIKRTLSILFRTFLTVFLKPDHISTDYVPTLGVDTPEDVTLRKVSRAQFAINKIYCQQTRLALRSLFTRTDDLNYKYLDYIRSNGTSWLEILTNLI